MHLVTDGIVVEGDHRGREIGYPTANINFGVGVELPEDGVYAGTAEREDHSLYVAAISVGHRPTFYTTGGPRLLEAYLLDFDGDLYGERLRVTITELVRPQAQFATRAELIAQIAADVDWIRSLTLSAGPDGLARGAQPGR
jgi:riboflavin kinase/FMN adenylyltransferase